MSGGWIKLYRSLLDDPVWTTATGDQKAVLIVILLTASHERNQWFWQGRKFEVQPGQFVSSLGSLAAKAGVSIKSVRSAIARFEKLGFLANESAKTGRLISILNWSSYQVSEDSPGKEVGKGRAKTGQVSRRVEGKKEDPLVGWDEFWLAFPRKVGKTDAIRAWKRLNPTSDLQKNILASLEQHKSTDQWKKDGGKYVPHPATWLNGRRWEDELRDLHQNLNSPKEDPSKVEALRREHERSEELARRLSV